MGTTDTKINKAMAAELQAERSALKMTVEELAEASGVPFGTLRRVLNGKVDVVMADIAGIAAAFTEKAVAKGGKPVTPSELVERAVKRAGGYEKL